ncbi:hypothetical protein [Sphingomonas sp. GC_Shp_3]|uniref:hypothetical protein n=1 Tax=Sphingomonas sp. GC_Shp_3 TaxID=2937383 RepID=UPI00226A9898|nr:hypothetical protein [Sphingomonas sp. GC_Shp_3]
MRRMLGGAVAALVGLSGHAAAATEGPAVCWDDRTLSAARVVEFREIGLDVQLRCRLIGLDLTPGYVRVLERYRGDFDAADGAIKAHYHADDGRTGWIAYQRYITHVTNIYGGGATTVTHCQTFASVLGELSSPEVPAGALGAVVAAMVKDPHVDATICG